MVLNTNTARHTKPEFKDDPLCKEKVYSLRPLPGLTEVGKDVTFEKYFKHLIRFVRA
jgi:hypothetical protein